MVAASGHLTYRPWCALQLHGLWHCVVLHVPCPELTLVVASHRIYDVVVYENHIVHIEIDKMLSIKFKQCYNIVVFFFSLAAIFSFILESAVPTEPAGVTITYLTQ